ncbi:MAG: flagellar filament capping protein FliD [Planctomycetes bacterium]|nr:flagellar filament capping protein FliD [Planctomycetota bacterium]
MGEIRLPGLATGIDTGKLVEQLIQAESRRLSMLEQQKIEYEEKRNAINDLQNKLSALESTTQSLSDSSQLRGYNAVTSDEDYMTADASSNAFEGNHSVEIKQLATGERFVHDGLEFPEDLVGEGTFIYSYNNKETSITTTTETTLDDLVGLINNDSGNPGVNASLLVYDDGNDGVYHLVLSGKESGSDYAIRINSSSTEVLKADSAFTYNSDPAVLTTKLTDLDQFTGSLVGGEVMRIEGTDRYNNDITLVDYPITANTKLSHLVAEINDFFDGNAKAVLEDGVIYLTDTASGSSSLSLTLTFVPNGDGDLDEPLMEVDTTGGATTADLTGFAGSDFTKTQSAQDSKIKVDGYPAISAVAEEQEIDHSTAATSGTYYLTYKGETTGSLDYTADIATIQAAIDALSTVNSGDITVSGTALNASGTMTFTFDDSLGNTPMILMDSSALSSTYVVTEQTKGQDNWISRSANTVDDVISGVTLRLHDTTEDGEGGYNSIEVTMSRDTETLKEKIDSMITAYNTVVMFIKDKTAYDEEKKKSGILAGDYNITTILSRIKTVFTAAAGGFTSDDPFTLPGDIGIDLGADGMLKLDTEDFNEAIVDDYLAVLKLIGAMKGSNGNSTGTDADKIDFLGASKFTTSGEFNVRVTTTDETIDKVEIEQSDGTWREVDAANISGNSVIATDSDDFDSYGNPYYLENDLQFTVNTTGLTGANTLTVTIRVKEGFAGNLDARLDDMLDSVDGRVVISKDRMDDKIEYVVDRMDREITRLELSETRLIAKFARLERLLSMIQQQMAGISML